MDGASQTPHLSKTRRSGCIVALNECPISLKFQALLIQSGCNKSLKNLSQWPNGLSPPTYPHLAFVIIKTTPCFSLRCRPTAKSVGASGGMAISCWTLKGVADSPRFFKMSMMCSFVAVCPTCATSELW